MGDYEANARMDRAVNALADLKAAVEKMSVDIEQSIEWSTDEITRSIDGLTKALIYRHAGRRSLASSGP